MKTTKKYAIFDAEYYTKRPSALIVDDDELVLATLCSVFKSAGFLTKGFADAREFLAHIDEFKSAENTCIILDLRMPIIGGLDLQTRLKDQGADLPVIFYTGTADVSVTVRAMNAGAFTVLEKPLSSQVLIDQAHCALRQHRLQRERRTKIRTATALLAQLSGREWQITGRLVQGMTAFQAASELHISSRTVETHRSHIFQKLAIKSVASLAQLVTLAEMADNDS
jgi:FixJ family two-component response regulator